jgi:hypothetical protein
MAAEDNTRELVKKYVADMHSLLEHGHKAIKRQRGNLKDSQFPDALALVADFEEVLDRHTNAFEQHLKSIGGNASSPVQDTAGAVAGFMAGLYNAVRSEEASKSIRDDYTFFSHTAIAGLMLHATCKALGDEQTATFATNVYRDAAKCIERIDMIMPKLIVHELQKDGLSARDVSSLSHELISSSWGTMSAGRAPSSAKSTSATTPSHAGAGQTRL